MISVSDAERSAREVDKYNKYFFTIKVKPQTVGYQIFMIIGIFKGVYRLKPQ